MLLSHGPAPPFRMALSSSSSLTHLDRCWGQILAGAEVVDHARLCFRFFSLLGDSGTVGGTCSGTARSDGDCEREREKSLSHFQHTSNYPHGQVQSLEFKLCTSFGTLETAIQIAFSINSNFSKLATNHQFVQLIQVFILVQGVTVMVCNKL